MCPAPQRFSASLTSRIAGPSSTYARNSLFPKNVTDISPADTPNARNMINHSIIFIKMIHISLVKSNCYIEVLLMLKIGKVLLSDYLRNPDPFLPILTVSLTPISVSQEPHTSWMFRQHLITWSTVLLSSDSLFTRHTANIASPV